MISSPVLLTPPTTLTNFPGFSSAHDCTDSGPERLFLVVSVNEISDPGGSLVVKVQQNSVSDDLDSGWSDIDESESAPISSDGIKQTAFTRTKRFIRSRFGGFGSPSTIFTVAVCVGEPP